MTTAIPAGFDELPEGLGFTDALRPIYRRGGAPTLNLSFDFIAAAKPGDWIQAEVERVTVKRRVAFSSGAITTGATLVCRFSGGFYLPDHPGLQPAQAIIDKLTPTTD
jgi:acyl-coenzyme A thioesterase PaaI-like protein